MGVLARFIGYLFSLGAVLFLLCCAGVAAVLYHYSQDLPDYNGLRDYSPPVMTRFQASNGDLIAEYAHERRLFLPIQSMPEMVKQAFVSAEDKNFYKHGGLDYEGIGRAIVVNLRNRGSDKRLVGASTITQQVAKNFLLSSDVAFERKIREAILALRIETAFTKDEILELYLNDIYLGVGAYGVAAAALTYYNKSVHELTLEEAAYLAALPKGPNNYHPYRYRERAIERRNYVLGRMYEDGYITLQQRDEAQAKPLLVTLRETGTLIATADYFAEEVRRTMIDQYGEQKLYEGGLSVRTTLNPDFQKLAHQVLRKGLVKFDRQKGWRGAYQTLDLAQTEWGEALGGVPTLSDVPEWTLAVVLSTEDDQAIIGLMPAHLPDGTLSNERKEGIIPLSEMTWARWATGDRQGQAVKRTSDVLAVGDVVFVSAVQNDDGRTHYALEQLPEVQGGLVAMDPYTGRVHAMVGGFSFAQSQFNRATQAKRQPGSSFKPFIYAAALDNGYTPSSVILDAPVEIEQGPGLPVWRPENYSEKFYGPQTLRVGIENSRNVMTVRLAQDMGMPLIVEYARRFGIYDNLMPVLSMSLGAGETTLMRMTTAYAIIANGGRSIVPTVIDRVQDRYGKTIYHHDQRLCETCKAQNWANQAEPEIIDEREHVLDPMTAYQITSMMQGVVQRGTAAGIKSVLGDFPIAGKTGSTNDYKDAWFIGFSPNLVVGVYIGYDVPRSMGRGATGGVLAAPVFANFMKVALDGVPPVEFRIPKGLQLIPIDRRTGLHASAGAPNAILEAFKPGTMPPDTYSIIGSTDASGRPLTVTPEQDRAVISGTGGLY